MFRTQHWASYKSVLLWTLNKRVKPPSTGHMGCVCKALKGPVDNPQVNRQVLGQNRSQLAHEQVTTHSIWQRRGTWITNQTAKNCENSQ